MRSSRPVPGAGLRSHLVSLLLVTTVWLVAPGTTQPDTKFSLVESPWRYLTRALQAWNDHAGLGELQNQAYGYLFPMGPVFGLGDWLGLPAWATQRVWWTLLVLVGFWGVHRVATRLFGFDRDIAALVAVVYVLSPRFLTVLAPISIEAWPASVAPWLLLAAAPLLVQTNSRRARFRSLTSTALLTAALGGVNATASAAVLLLPFVWILTAPSAANRLRSLLLWCGAVAVGAFWWLIPLFVLGRHAYPFLEYIETSRITTAVTSVTNVLRGADHWIAYILDSAGHPVWQGGWVQAQYPVAIVSSAVVAAAGIFGILRLRAAGGSRHALRFLVTSLLLGTVLMTLGHGGVLSSPLAELVRGALDGFAAPLRNVHKFDPLVRLPIALGVGHAFVSLSGWSSKARPWVTVALGLVLILAPTSLWAGRSGTSVPVVEVPEQWRQVAELVDAEATSSGGATLVLPNARDAAMTWGTVSDEPLTALAASPVIHRAAAPLGHPGGVRLLDRFNALAASGHAQPELLDLSRRLGVTRIVLRKDVRDEVRMLSPEAFSKTFGATVGFDGPRAFGDDIELWNVDVQVADAELVPRELVVPVSGVPEDLPGLLRSGNLTPQQVFTVVSGDEADVLTDSSRWSVFNSGLPPELGLGPTLDAHDTAPSRIGARPLPPLLPVEESVVRSWRGLESFATSSDGSDPFGELLAGPGAGKTALIDGDRSTTWWSNPERSSWIEFSWADPTDLGLLEIDVAVGPGLHPVPGLELRVLRSSGATEVLKGPVDESGTAVWELGADPVKELTVRFPEAPLDVVRGIKEIRSPALSGAAMLVLPHAWSPGHQQLQLATTPVGQDLVQRLLLELVREPEGTTSERWLTELDGAGTVEQRLFVKARQGADVEELLDRFSVSSKHRLGADPMTRPGALLDLDPETRWTVGAGEPEAVIAVELDESVRVGKVGPAPGASRIRVKVDGRAHQLPGTGGVVEDVGDRIEIAFIREWDDVGTEDWVLEDVSVEGLDRIGRTPRTFSCDAARTRVGDVETNWKLPDSWSGLVRGETIELAPCGSARVEARGDQLELEAQTATWLQREIFLLAPYSTVAEEEHETVPTLLDEIGDKRFDVTADVDSILVLHQGHSSGWRAVTGSGEELAAIEVDGWRQGFVVPAGFEGQVQLEFVPQRAHVAGLGVGLLLALLALVLHLLSGRPRGDVSLVVPEALKERGRSALLAASLAPVGLGVLLGGIPGFFLGVLGAAVPARFRALLGAGLVATAGCAMAGLGVVDRASTGAVTGQVLGILVLTLVASSGFGSVPLGELVSRRGTRKRLPDRG